MASSSWRWVMLSVIHAGTKLHADNHKLGVGTYMMVTFLVKLVGMSSMSQLTQLHSVSLHSQPGALGTKGEEKVVRRSDDDVKEKLLS